VFTRHEIPITRSAGTSIADRRPAMNPENPIPQGDPFLRPSATLANRVARLAWGAAYWLLFRPSPRPMHAWRSSLLRLFGAKLGADCHIYPRARIWAPWNLVCEDVVAIADDAEIYNAATIVLRSHSTVSQNAYLCGATHDCDDPAFPIISLPITIGRYGWIAARATVQAGVSVGEGAVLGLGAVATRNLDAWCVYGGIPANLIRKRRCRQ
jgi:putative colanic acid biosynthesis acetyltransferase WcaF